ADHPGPGLGVRSTQPLTEGADEPGLDLGVGTLACLGRGRSTDYQAYEWHMPHGIQLGVEQRCRQPRSAAAALAPDHFHRVIADTLQHVGKQLLLGTEIAADQRRIDAGLGSNGTHPDIVVTVLYELVAG